MTQQLIITTPANSSTGDSPKAAFDKCNANFTDVYNQSAGVSVLSYGADPTGVADSTAAITAAAAAGKNVIFPAGTYLINGTPTIPTGVILTVQPGATFSGAGAGPLGFGTGSSALYTEMSNDTNPSVNEAAAFSFVRLASYTGGTNVHNTVRIQTNVGANVTDFEWGLLSVINNYATAGENVAIYGQGNKETGAGPTWGGVFAGFDRSGSGNPTSGLIGVEIDLQADGPDNNLQRVALDVVGCVGISVGPTIGYGVRVGPQNGTITNANFLNGVYLYGVMTRAINIVTSGSSAVGIDTSSATLSAASLRIANTQYIGFDSSDTHRLGLNAGILWLSVSGTTQAGWNASGGSVLNQGVTVIPGTVTANGSTAPALTANKPGTTTAIQAWANWTYNSTSYVFPLYSPS